MTTPDWVTNPDVLELIEYNRAACRHEAMGGGMTYDEAFAVAVAKKLGMWQFDDKYCYSCGKLVYVLPARYR